MAFGTTITLTVNSVAKVLNRINQDNYGSEYYLRNTTDEYRLKIRHSKDSPNASGQVYDRHNMEVVRTVFATSTVPQYTQTQSWTQKVLSSDAVVDAGYLADAFVNYIDSATVQGDMLVWLS